MMRCHVLYLFASLLTMAAVSRRVREFGTLKALGWKSRRIVGQVMGEGVVMSIIGGAIGVALGPARDRPPGSRRPAPAPPMRLVWTRRLRRPPA
jgi:predicted lysophospholipase L1 biosynthesis ABC-type transport system permease subunit